MVVKLRIARRDAIQGEDSYLTGADTSRQFPEKDRSFFPSSPPALAALRARENLGLSAGKPLSLPHRPCSVGSELNGFRRDLAQKGDVQ
jgi:hypothetical protein